MSVKVMGLVWDVKMPPNEKLVLLAYADHAAHDGTSIYPAVASIAEKTGYGEREVQRVTRTLEKKGLLVSDGTGPRGTNRWRCEIGGDNLSPVTTEGVTSATPRGDIDKGQGVTPVSPESSLTVIEPSTRGALSQTGKDQANAKVSAMIENASTPTYLNRDKIPEQYLRYADTYNALTGQEPTKRVIHDWLMTFSEWASEGIRPEHVRQAHKESVGRFNVLRPGSLTNMAAALKAKGKVATSTVRDELRESKLRLEERARHNALRTPMPDATRDELDAFFGKAAAKKEP